MRFTYINHINIKRERPILNTYGIILMAKIQCLSDHIRKLAIFLPVLFFYVEILKFDEFTMHPVYSSQMQFTLFMPI